MTTSEFLKHLRAQGIRLDAEAGDLRVKAPRGVLNDEIREQIRQRKGELLEVLESTSSIPTIMLPAPRDESIPLSYAQQRLWFLEQLDPGTAAYNIPWAISLEGRLDLGALESALDDLAMRHESLRTVFPAEHGRPVQALADTSPIRLERFDAADLTHEQMMGQLEDLAKQPFDLVEGPLIRVHLFTRDPGRHVLLVVMHHIITDGTSMRIFLRDLVELYGSRAESRPSELPDLYIQYPDYAIWQRERLGSRSLRSQLQYWTNRLAGAPPVLELPTDNTRPETQSLGGGWYAVSASVELTRKLRELAKQFNYTPFMLTLTVFYVLLYRYTRVEDMVVGIPVAGRKRREVENLIGFFVNSLALRIDLSGPPTFRELAERVRDAVVDALSRQDLPFEKLVEELHPARDQSRPPIFQVMFDYQEVIEADQTAGGVVFQPQQFINRNSSIVDLLLSIGDRGEQIDIRFEYATELFGAETVQRIAEQYLLLLERFIVDPDRPVDQMSLLRPPDRLALLKGWEPAASTGHPGQTLHGLFEEQVAAHPHRTALVFEGEEASYQDLNRRANQLAHRLIQLGVRPDGLVGLCAHRNLDMIAGIIGILKAGGAYLPLDPDLPDERLRFIVGDAQVQYVVTTGEVPVAIMASDAQPVDMRNLRSDLCETNPELIGGPDNLAYVIYTSGSTGQPKGSLIEHRNVTRLFSATDDWFGFGPADVWTVFHSFAFDFSVWEIWGALLYGGKAVIVPYDVSRSAHEFYDLLIQEQVTVLNQTPTAFYELMREDHNHDPQANSLRWIIFGGEALNVPALSAWFARHGEEMPSLVNMYGITETTVHVTYRKLKQQDCGNSTSVIGVPIPDLGIYLLDDELNPAAPGTVGEIYVAGGGVGRGYLNRPALTADRFIQHRFPELDQVHDLYRSGDLARCNSDGEFEYLGRSDQQLKLRGFRIEPGEIESQLLEQPEIDQCKVLVRQTLHGDSRLVAYFTSLNQNLDRGSILEKLRHRLPQYMVPSALVAIKHFPMTANGKLDQKALPEPDWGAADLTRYVEPRTSLEARIAGIFGDLLEVEQVGANDDFFGLGGHSLLATQLVSRIRDALGVALPLRQLFANPTVAALAEAVRLEVVSREQSAPSPRPDDHNELPLTDAQRRFWFLDELDPGTPAYNITWAARLDGPLDEAALQRAVGLIANRHESLRTSFCQADGEVIQRVHSSVEIPVELIESDALAAGELVDELAELARHSFDLAACPLCRVSLLRLGPDDHVLLLILHHIIADGWSLNVLVRDLGTAYNFESKGKPLDWPVLPIQYGDFALWQQRYMDSGEAEEQLDYWRSALADIPALLNLPVDRNLVSVKNYRGAWVEGRLNEDLTRSVNALARRTGCTVYMVLLAAFNVLLARHTGQEDIVIGAPVAGRRISEVENLVGLFLNSVPLRTDLSGNPDFLTLLHRVRRGTGEAYAHQDVPFEKLVEELNPSRTTGQSPIFQVLFNLHNEPVTDFDFHGLEVRPLIIENEFAKVTINVHMLEADGCIHMGWQYVTDLFDRETLENLVAQFQVLLNAAAESPEEPIARLRLTHSDQRFLGTAVELVPGHEVFPLPEAAESLPAAFSRVVGRHGKRPAVRGTSLSWSFDELDGVSNGVAQELVDSGVARGDRVALLYAHDAAMLAGILGVLKAGGVYVPLDPVYPASRQTAVLADCGAKVLVCEGQFNGLAQELAGSDCLVISADSVTTWDHPPEITIEPDDLAYILYTSGSTGEPKGVMQTHRNVLHHIGTYSNALKLSCRDRLSLLSTYCFDAGVMDIFGALLNGAELYPMDLRSGLGSGDLVDKIASSEITVYHSTPTVYRFLFREESTPKPNLSKTRLVVLGGEEARRSDHRIFRKRFERHAVLINGLGPTESTLITQFFADSRTRLAAGPLPVGLPVARTELLIINDEGQHAGISGELAVRSDYVTPGYWNRPDLTEARFIVDPDNSDAKVFRTGDLVRRLPDGNLIFLGRRDSQVKIRGYRVETGEIESAILSEKSVRLAAVDVREKLPDEQYLVAYLEGDIDVPDLRTQLRKKLPEYLVPTIFMVVDSLPRLPNGKIDRNRLPEPDWSAWVQEEFVAPVTENQKIMAVFWQQLLDVERVGLGDDFFALGGHSLLATRLISRVREVMGVDMPLVTIFEHVTLSDFSDKVEQLLAQGQTVDRAPIPRQNRLSRRLSR